MSGSSTPTPSNRISDIHAEIEKGHDTKSAFSESASGSDIEVMEETETSTCWKILKLVVASICGIIFGIASEKTRVYEPMVIREQMVFEIFIMLKMFLAATASGQICFSILSLLPQTKDKFKIASDSFVTAFINKGILTSTVGPFVLGMGMTMAGTCPGMVLGQIGTWVPNSIFTLIGALLGTLSYGCLAPYITKLTRPKEPYKKTNVHQVLKKPFALFAIPMALLLVITVVLLEYYWSWQRDVERLQRANTSSNIITATSWPPFVGGIMVGVLQLPIVLIFHDTIGGSSSYVTVVSQWTVTSSLQERFPYLANMRCGIHNWWQVFYVMFAVVGAAISGATSGTLATSKGVPVYFALIGGFFTLFGARFGSGCTSGHGLSGMGMLAWLSFIAVPAMFAGGISLGFIMQTTGSLDNYVTRTGDV